MPEMRSVQFRVDGEVVNVYDAPSNSRQSNWLELTPGVKPGLGRFLIQRKDYATIRSEEAVTLRFHSLDSSFDVPVYVLGAVPYSDAMPGGDDNTDMWEVIVTDQRYLSMFSEPFNVAYNMQRTDRPFDANGAARFHTNSLNGGSEWTWSEILTLQGLPSITGLTPSVNWKPRSFSLEGLTVSRAVDMIARKLMKVVGFDWTAGLYTFNDPSTFGSINGSDSLRTAIESDVGSGTGLVNSSRMPLNVAFMFRVVDGSRTDRSVRFHKIDGGTDTGDSAFEHALFVADYLAHYNDGSVQNASELDTVAQWLGEAFGQMTARTPGTLVLPDLYPFVLDGQIRCVRWVCDAFGARTMLRSDDDRPFMVDDPDDYLYATGIDDHLVIRDYTGQAVASGPVKPLIYKLTPCVVEDSEDVVRYTSDDLFDEVDDVVRIDGDCYIVSEPTDEEISCDQDVECGLTVDDTFDLCCDCLGYKDLGVTDCDSGSSTITVLDQTTSGLQVGDVIRVGSDCKTIGTISTCTDTEADATITDDDVFSTCSGCAGGFFLMTKCSDDSSTLNGVITNVSDGDVILHDDECWVLTSQTEQGDEVAIHDPPVYTDCNDCLQENESCGGCASGYSTATGTGVDSATAISNAVQAAKDACGYTDSSTPYRGIDVCDCDSWEVDDGEGGTEWFAVVCYNCCCDEGEVRIEQTDYSNASALTLDGETCEIVAVTRYICAKLADDCSESCPA